jgi:TPR repeat protein
LTSPDDEFSRKAIKCDPKDGLGKVIEALSKDAKKIADKAKEMQNIMTMVEDGFYEEAKSAIVERLLKRDENEEKKLRILLLKVSVDDSDSIDFKNNLLHLKHLCSEAEIKSLEEEFPCIVDYEKLYEEAREVRANGDINTAIKLLDKVAKTGHKEANYELGEIYYFGREIGKDVKKAIGYYDVSANRGHADANRKLGTLYNKGINVEKNEDRAFAYFLVGAKLGNAFCCRMVGNYYKEKFNEDEAFKWYKEGAKKGDAYAAYELSKCYKYGTKNKNINYAQQCLKYAAEHGVTEAVQEYNGH